MQENRITAILSQGDRQEVLDALNLVRNKLPFLIDLSLEERKALPKMGDSGRGFVFQALQVAEQNPDILPRSFDVGEMRNDVELYSALSTVHAALAQLFELVDDTLTEVGAESYAAALLVYQSVRAAGKGTALDAALEGLSQRFARKSRGTPPDQS